MKINQLEIVGFGHWRNKVIPLDSQMVLLFGGNEAGKTTIYFFILTILFGFPSKRQGQRDYTPKDGGSFGGHLIVTHPRYGRAKISRFKGVDRHQGRVQLLDDPGQPELSLATFLAPLTEAAFKEVYTLEQGQLVDVGEVSEERLQGLLLTIGLAGSSELFAKQESWQGSQETLYKVRGHKPAINEKLVAYRQLQEKIQQQQAAESTYQQLIQEEAKWQQVFLEGQLKREKMKTEVSLTREQLEKLPQLSEYQYLSQQLTREFSTTLKPRELQELKNKSHHLDQLNRQEAQYLSEKQRYLTQQDLSPRVTFYMANEQELSDLAQEQLALGDLLNQASYLSEQLAETESTITYYCRELGVTTSPETIKPLPLSVEETLTDIVSVQGNLTKALQDKQQQVQLATNQYDTLRQKQQAVQVKLKGVLLLPLLLVIASAIIVFTAPAVALPLGVASVISLFLILGGRQWHRQATLTKLATLAPVTLRKEVAELEGQLEEVAEAKEQLGVTYHFPAQLTAKDWQMQLPMRGHLQALLAKSHRLAKEQAQVTTDLARYETALDQWQDWLPAGGGLGERMARLVQFNQEMSQESQRLMSKGQATSWAAPLKALQQTREEEHQQLVAKYPELQSLSVTDFIAKQDRYQELKAKEKDLKEALEKTYDLEIITTYQQETLTRTLNQQEAKERKLHEDIEEADTRQREAQFALQKMAADGTLADLYQEEAALKDDLLALASQWASYAISSSVVEEFLNHLSEQRLPSLLKTASLFFKQLTLNQYSRCDLVHDQLMISNNDGVCYYLNDLSTGTRDQLYLALRLAFIELYQEPSLSPLIIDDGWLHYDSQRKVALFNVLKEVSQSTQVICLSSDQELYGFAKANQLIIEHL